MGAEVATFVVAWVIHMVCLFALYVLFKVLDKDEHEKGKTADAAFTFLILALISLWVAIVYFPWAE